MTTVVKHCSLFGSITTTYCGTDKVDNQRMGIAACIQMAVYNSWLMKKADFWSVSPHSLVDINTSISEKSAVSIFRRGRQIPQKCWYLSTKLHGIIFHKSIILMFTTVRTVLYHVVD